MSDSHFELFDHTADMGVRVTAPTLAELVAPAIRGLYAVIGEMVATGDGEPRSWELAGHDPALLVRDLLAELLRLFETRRLVAQDVQVAEFTADRLAVGARLRKADPQASDFVREAKAVTYHELQIRTVPAGKELTYIVDI